MSKFLSAVFMVCSVVSVNFVYAADASVQLTTTDGSTYFSIENSTSVEVARMDSLGGAHFVSGHFGSGASKSTFTSAGHLQMPAGATITVGGVRGTVIPAGTLILTTATCPSGFTEYTAAQGFYLVGVPAGGTVGGTVGSAMTDLSNANHTHTVTHGTAANTTTALGNQPRVTDITNPASNVARGTVAPYFQIRLCMVP